MSPNLLCANFRMYVQYMMQNKHVVLHTIHHCMSYGPPGRGTGFQGNNIAIHLHHSPVNIVNTIVYYCLNSLLDGCSDPLSTFFLGILKHVKLFLHQETHWNRCNIGTGACDLPTLVFQRFGIFSTCRYKHMKQFEESEDTLNPCCVVIEDTSFQKTSRLVGQPM